MNQLLMAQGVCAKVLGNQTFNDVVTPQNVVLNNPDGASGEFISPAKNPYSPGIKISQMNLTKEDG